MAKKKVKLSDAELYALIDQEIAAVDVENYSTISGQRIDANLAFAHQYTQDTIPKDQLSTVLFNFTTPVTETLSTYMSKQFSGNKKTVAFQAFDPELQPAADQAAMMANAVIHRTNPGFNVLNTGFKSAALNKNAIFYTYFDDSAIMPISEVLETDDEEQVVAHMEENEVLGYIAEEADYDEKEQKWSIKSFRPGNRIRIECIPPEEFLINEGTTSINDDPLTRFVARRQMMYKSDIEAYAVNLGIDIDWNNVSSGTYATETTYEKDLRHSFDDTYDQNYNPETGHEPTRTYEVIHSWIRADWDGDGYAEWRCVVSIGPTIIYNEEWIGPLPFTSFTYFDVPHKFYGLGVYDKIRQYEKIAVALVRGNVNSTIIRNTPRWLFNSTAINPTVLNKITTGFIGVKGNADLNSVVKPLDNSGGTPGDINPVIQLVKEQIIGEFGIDYVKGQISTDIDKSGNDSTKTAMAIDNASARVEKYARAFADTALRDMTWQIINLLVQHKDDPFVQELAAAVTPESPTFLLGELGLQNVLTKNDLVATVGLGHMTGPQKIAASQSMLAIIQQLTTQPSVALYMLAKEAYEGWGYQNAEELLGSFEEYQQKAQLMQQQQQSTIQTQQSQAQVAQGQMQQQQTQIKIMQTESAAKIAREDRESEAKIAYLMAQTDEKGTKSDLNEAQADEIYATIGGEAPQEPIDVVPTPSFPIR